MSQRDSNEMKRRYAVICAAALLASAAFAHQGVQNAAVKARMDSMSAISQGLKVLGAMAKGEAAFDATTARAAAADIARHAAETPALFAAPETDPKSEALPVIWDQFDDFTAQSQALESIARGLSTSLSAPQDLGPALAALGASCKSCHEAYRE